MPESRNDKRENGYSNNIKYFVEKNVFSLGQKRDVGKERACVDDREQLERQKRILIKFAYWGMWGTVVFFLVKYIGPVLFPFFVAFLVAWMLSKPIDVVAEKTHLKRKLVAVFAVILFFACIGAFFCFVGNRLAGFVQSISAVLTAFLSDSIFPMLETFFVWIEQICSGSAANTNIVSATGDTESAEVLAQAGKVLSGVSEKAIDGVSNVAACIPEIFMKIVIAVIATVFIELEFHDISKFLRNQIPEKWRKTVTEAKTYFMETFGKCIFSYGMIFVLTYVELVLGFLVLGIDGAFVIALVIALLDILPVLGTGTVLLPWSVLAAFAGNIKISIGIFLLYLVITVIRNIAEPKLVGRQMGLSPVVMLPCMLVGLKLFGIIGMFGLPLAVAFFKDLNDRGILHILKNDK